MDLLDEHERCDRPESKWIYFVFYHAERHFVEKIDLFTDLLVCFIDRLLQDSMTWPVWMSYHFLADLMRRLEAASKVTPSVAAWTSATFSTRLTQVMIFSSSVPPNSGICEANQETLFPARDSPQSARRSSLPGGELAQRPVRLLVLRSSSSAGSAVSRPLLLGVVPFRANSC